VNAEFLNACGALKTRSALRVFIICIAFMLYWPFGHSATESPVPGKEKDWYSCTNSSDCKFGSGICGGPTPVNKKFLRQFDKWTASMRPKVNCTKFLPSTDWDPNLVAVCKDGQCAAETLKKGEAK
jgi:hypothetical protein